MKKKDDCLIKVKNEYLNFLKKEKIFYQSKEDKIKILKKIYIPMSFWIEKKYKEKGKTLILGFSGGQGSGKTTIANILKIILRKFFKRKIYVTSIDDYYKTYVERKKMSEKKHHLFETRGVPGTHDMFFLKKFFKRLKNTKFKKILLPKFDKSNDDRLKRKYWYNVSKKPEIVILEGWCVGAKPQANPLIKKPINELEKYEDANLTWRSHVNEKLKREYKKIFAMIDFFIFLKIPNFNMVFKWRLLQEKKMKKRLKFGKKIMSYIEIKRFIMFYQRITLQMVKDLSKSASIVVFLKKNHQIEKILYR